MYCRVVTAQAGADVSYDNADETALSLTWTNPNYMLNTGVSSLDVSYNIIIDTADAFSSAQQATITVSKELSYSFSVSSLNDIMLNTLQLKAGVPHTLHMRVMSLLANSSAKLASNTVQLTATPYSIPPKVAVPSQNELYITGSATAGNWMVGGDPSSVPANQEFTRVDETNYTITVDLIAGNEYLFVPVAGNWDVKYGAVSTATSAGGGFQYNNGSNFKAPAASGTYIINVDFQRGVFTVSPK